MTSVLYRLGGACVRHRWIVLAVWLVVFLALAGWARSVGTNVNDNLTLPGTNSQRATDVLDAHFPSQANGVIPVAMLAPAGAKLTDSRFAKPIADTVKALKADPASASATSPLSCAGEVAAQQGQDDRLHRAAPAPEPRSPDRSTTRTGSSTPAPAREGRGLKLGVRWLPRPEGVQARARTRARSSGSRRR